MTDKTEFGSDTIGSAETSRNRTLQGGAAGLLALFAFGVAAGLTAKVIEIGAINPRQTLILIAVLAIAAVSGLFAWRRLRQIAAEPVGARTRRARKISVVSMVIGIAVGLVLSLSSSERGSLFAEPHVAPWAAILLSLVFVVVVPFFTLAWWRALDEHEAQAYSLGALVALNAYCSVTPSWWLLWRADLAGPVPTMAIFVGTVLLWCAVWLWKRYF